MFWSESDESLKVFISQPFNGRTYEQIQKERDLILSAAKRRFQNKLLLPIISYEAQNPEVKHPNSWFLGKALIRMSDAEVVIFSPDWKKSPGCRIEYQCCKEYGIPHVILNHKEVGREGEM